MTTIVLWEADGAVTSAEDRGDHWQIIDLEMDETGRWSAVSSFRLEKAWLPKLMEART